MLYYADPKQPAYRNHKRGINPATGNGLEPVSPAELGACGCCGMGALVDNAGNLLLLYRTARETVHRDMYLLASSDGGRSFKAINVHSWEIGACPMSTVSMARDRGQVLLAWETATQVYFATLDSQTLNLSPRMAALGRGSNRKHPAIAVAQTGELLLAWTEGTGWKKGGSVAWQRFDKTGHPVGGPSVSPGLPAWNFATVWTGNRFLVIS